MSASCQHSIWTIHFVIALMKWQAACSCSTCLGFFFFQGVCVCVCELSMGKGLSAAECHSLTGRYVGSCQFVPRTEWEACSMQFNGWAFKCTWFRTAISSILTFWVCLYCLTYPWEHYFATRCPFKRALAFQAVIGTVGVQDSSLRVRKPTQHRGCCRQWLHPAVVPRCQGGGRHEGLLLTQKSQWLHSVCFGIVWHGSIQRLSVLAQASISLACHTFKQVWNPGGGCLFLCLVTQKWLSTFLNLFLALQLAFRLVSVRMQQGAEENVTFSLLEAGQWGCSGFTVSE